MKKCPYCAEEIQDEAVKCKHCGESLLPRASVSPQSTGSDKWKIIRNELLSSSPKWMIRYEEEDTLQLVYREEAKKPGCTTGCLIAILCWPLAVIYGLLGGKDSKSEVVTISFIDDAISITGDPRRALRAFKLLATNPQISQFLVENDVIKKAKTTQLINTILWVVIVLFFLFFISSSGS